ncbi:MAG: LL-diaminopimelate aminotransferase [bacterium]
MCFSFSDKINHLPKYLFAQIDEIKKQVASKGINIINLGIGDPDIPTPSHIIDALIKSVQNPVNHQYPSYNGLLEFRKAVSFWFEKRFNIKLNPDQEIVSLIGSKEGIFHFPLAFINKEDIVLVPNPAYPVYKSGTIFAEGIPYMMPLLKENDFLPDLDVIPENIRNKAKIMFLNYPNNPTGAVASLEFFKKAVDFAHKYNIIIAHDNAYSEICFNNYKAPSIFQIDGSFDCAIEFHSLSKTYNMTGWRIGFAVGNKKLIKALGSVKENVDSGVFQPIQYAAITALTSSQDCIKQNINIYQKRREVVLSEFKKIGIEIELPKATIYLWIPVPNEKKSLEFCQNILEKTGVVFTPGIGFGEYGEGYFRISLTLDEVKLQEAISRIKNVL